MLYRFLPNFSLIHSFIHSCIHSFIASSYFHSLLHLYFLVHLLHSLPDNHSSLQSSLFFLLHLVLFTLISITITLYLFLLLFIFFSSSLNARPHFLFHKGGRYVRRLSHTCSHHTILQPQYMHIALHTYIVHVHYNSKINTQLIKLNYT